MSRPVNPVFGMMGLGVMGRNLALNVEDRGFPVAVWNFEADWVDEFLTGEASGRRFAGHKSIKDFVEALPRPRRIMMMIKAGDPVDSTLDKLVPHLEKGDIVVDGGNSHFQDTIRREKNYREKGFRFFGVGVSGGESGARRGPSLMPGGDRSGYQLLKPVFEKIAAQLEDGPCVTYCGPDGAGHFVKTVHNGIEYGDMQLIAEAYELMRSGLGFSAGRMADVFGAWNSGPLDSYLVEITSKILTVQDDGTKRPLVDVILDRAGQKGTGKWTSQAALDLGIAVPTIHAAIESRFVSALKSERERAARILAGPAAHSCPDEKDFLSKLHDALHAAKISTYAQGMDLLRAGSDEYGWNTDLSEISRIWQGGCIIRARLLDRIKKAFREESRFDSLMTHPGLAATLGELHSSWREVVQAAQRWGVAVPALSASLAHYDAYRTARLPLNLTQAQRDFFGAHGYQRLDDPDGSPRHTDWMGIVGRVE